MNSDDPKKSHLPESEEKYNEAGVAGNDQNEAIRQAVDRGNAGNAEQSERGKVEFEADQNEEIDDKPDCQTLSDIGKKRDSDRGLAEFS